MGHSTGGPGLQLVSAFSQAVLWAWAPHLWGLCWPCVVSVRTELNRRTPRWYRESWRVDWCEEKAHTFGVRNVVSENILEVGTQISILWYSSWEELGHHPQGQAVLFWSRWVRPSSLLSLWSLVWLDSHCRGCPQLLAGLDFVNKHMAAGSLTSATFVPSWTIQLGALPPSSHLRQMILVRRVSVVQGRNRPQGIQHTQAMASTLISEMYHDLNSFYQSAWGGGLYSTGQYWDKSPQRCGYSHYPSWVPSHGHQREIWRLQGCTPLHSSRTGCVTPCCLSVEVKATSTWC